MSRRSVSGFMMAGLLLLSSAALFASGEPAAPPGAHVFVNQVGYLPGLPKRVVCDRPAAEFVVYPEGTRKPVYRGRLAAAADSTSGRRVWRGDFRGLDTPGTYRIEVPGAGSSHSFRIDGHVYRDVCRLGLRFYYLQRCGAALHDAETGLEHAACHRNDALLRYEDDYHPEQARLEATGGWHDAGDYGKYVPTTAVTAAHLLCLYQLWPERFGDGQTGIPESGNGVPDILDEARVGLDWLLAMQRPDGAVYHKLGGKRWPTLILPEQDTGDRYIFGISTFATAKFAAAAAMAARTFAKQDPEYAGKCAQAARKAWDYLSRHKFFWEHDQFDDEGSGAYGQSDDTADRLWAAAELTLLGEACPGLPDLADRYRADSIGWADAALLGLFALARSAAVPEELRQTAAHKLLQAAKRHLDASRKSGYGYTLSYQEFAWGSNREGLARGMVMLLADLLSPNPAYREAALAQLDFVLGMNPLSICFVTKMGTEAASLPHHRFDASAPRSVPGMLVGGPNNRAESGAEPAGLGPYSYIDSRSSYSSNEPAIDYNAALVFVAAAFAGE